MKISKMLAVALVLSAGTAHAQSAGAQAETLFRQGKDLMAKGKIAEACSAFEASQKLEPTIATLLNLAACREKNGQLATAYGLFLDAERQTRSGSDDTTRQRHQTAEGFARKLEPRLSTLTITVPDASRVGGLQIMRDSDVVEPGAWNKALPVDGGNYKISARAPGNAEWSSTITIGNEHDAKSIEIPRLKAAELGQAPVAAGPTEAASPATDQPRTKIVPLAVGGGAVLLAGGALTFELLARSSYSDAKKEIDDEKQSSLWHSANTKRYVAVSLGVASLACAGVAVWLYLRPSNESSSAQASRVHVLPLVTSDGGGLVVMGRY